MFAKKLPLALCKEADKKIHLNYGFHAIKRITSLSISKNEQIYVEKVLLDRFFLANLTGNAV